LKKEESAAVRGLRGILETRKQLVVSEIELVKEKMVPIVEKVIYKIL
jgi:hypothetical protein